MKRAKGFFGTAKKVIVTFLDDNCLNVAAAIVYYVLQSIVPLVLGVIVVASFALDSNPQARDDFVKAVRDALPSSGIDMREVIDGLTKSAPGLLSVTGILLLWSGSSIFESLIYGVNIAYGVRKDKRNFFKIVGLRFGMLFLLGTIIAASFGVTIVSQLIFSAKLEILGISPATFNFLLPLISLLIPVGLMFCVFLVLYKFGPDRRGVKWRPVMVGALVAAILFELLKYAFTFYITAFNAADSYAKTYGALGGILLFLFYLWLSAAVMLLGAVVAAVVGGWRDQPEPSRSPAPRTDAEAATSPQPELAGASVSNLSLSGADSAVSRRPAAPRSALNLLLGSAVVLVALVLSLFIKPKEPGV